NKCITNCAGLGAQHIPHMPSPKVIVSRSINKYIENLGCLPRIGGAQIGPYMYIRSHLLVPEMRVGQWVLVAPRNSDSVYWFTTDSAHRGILYRGDGRHAARAEEPIGFHLSPCHEAPIRR